MRLYQYSNSDMTAGGTWEQLGDTYTDSNGGKFYSCDSSANTVSYGYYDYSSGSSGSKILTYSSGTWTQKGQDLTYSAYDAPKLSSDGNTILTADGSYDSWRGKAQVYEYDSDNNLWVQKGNDILGQNQSYYMQDMTMNSDGNVISIGARFNPTGDAESGETRVYQYYSPTNEWVQIGDAYIGEAAGDKANYVEISGDGKVVSIVSEENDDNGDGAGHLRTFLTGYPATITSNIYTELSIPPTITSLTISSNNTENTKYAGENDVVTLNIVADVSMNEPTVSFTSGGVEVTGGVTYTGSDTSWTAQYTVNSADTLGSVAFTVDTQSVALLGNTSGVQVISTTNLSEVTIVDYTTASLVPPSITTLTIASNNTDNTKLAIANDVVTLNIVADININQPTVTFTSGNAAITNASAITYTGSDNSWTAQYTVDAADTVGEIGFTVDYSSALTSTAEVKKPAAQMEM